MKCNQTKCTFLNEHPDICPQCSECEAEPHDINEDCVNCWNCLKDEGYIRTGQPKQQKEKEKIIEVIR